MLKQAMWPRPGARNVSQQQKNTSAPLIVYRDQIRFSTKQVMLPQQDAIRAKQGHQQ